MHIFHIYLYEDPYETCSLCLFNWNFYWANCRFICSCNIQRFCEPFVQFAPVVTSCKIIIQYCIWDIFIDTVYQFYSDFARFAYTYLCMLTVCLVPYNFLTCISWSRCWILPSRQRFLLLSLYNHIYPPSVPFTPSLTPGNH